jgi:hypothetical protein
VHISKWRMTIRRAFLPFALVAAVCSLARSQTPATVTAQGEESYELQGHTLPEDPATAFTASAQGSALSDVSISNYPNADESRMPHSGSAAFIQTKPEVPPDKTVKWRVANQESLLFTGIMHTFNLWTEAGTRDTLNGHWLQNYLHSVGELRGWSDGDLFMSPYIGHTIEGAVFGYIERQNDPKYRAVQWGDGREYFISLLRSLAYSAIWHTQWKIGPASEASIGNVMLHASPGLITLTDTPTLGTVAMIGEDVADRYVIMGLENRTSNPALIMVARGFMNPSRSFANVMAFRVPWHRDMRMGIFGRNHQVRKEMLEAYHETGVKPFEYERPTRNENTTGLYPKEASIELTAFPVFQSFLGGGSCIGGGGSGAGRINSNWQFVAELSGCLVMHMPASNQSGDSLFYGGGVRWAPRASRRVSPYLQLMIGGNKVTHETDDIPLREQLLAEWNDGKGTLPHYPLRSDWSVQISKNAPAVKLAAGFDLVVSRPFAWRLLDLEYSHAWMGDVVNIHPQNALRISTGAVLRIGTW